MLPRDGVVVVALGPLKALIHTEACLVFEAGKGDIARIASLLAELMRANAKVRASDMAPAMSGFRALVMRSRDEATEADKFLRPR